MDTGKDYNSYRTVIGFNPGQSGHKNTICENHPENSNRITKIEEELISLNLLDDCIVLRDFCSIDENDLKQTHTSDYIDELLDLKDIEQQSQLNSYCEKYDSVFMSPESLNAASSAVACCRTLAEMIQEDKAQNGFAFVRPPGHHADPSSACGFCLFNNTAQAAEAAFNFGADRILIVDLDVHHGQGTQRRFYDDKRVLYFSIHRYQNGFYWPHLAESDFDHVGEGEARGYNVNVALNETGCGDADYLSILFNVLLPIAFEFDPDFVIVSAGFDSCIGDPLGEMRLSPDGYSHLIYQLKSLAKGKLLMILEGGYNHSISACAAARCVRVLTGNSPYATESMTSPKESTVRSCLNTISVQKAFWRCFDFYSIRPGTRSSEWESFKPVAEYNPPTMEQRSNTQDVIQEKLLSAVSYKRSHNRKKRTLIIYNKSTSGHHDSSDCDHVECPERTQHIVEGLENSGLMANCDVIVNTREAREHELELVHDRPYVNRLRRTQTLNDDELRHEENSLDSIFLTRQSFQVAKAAAGAVLESVDRVLSCDAGELNAFVVVRPPGHHAGISKPSGFCLFNNVAIAAQYAVNKFNLERVLILDWDVHHGNGTQEIFYEDNRVLYMSLHRHDEGTFYPVGEAKDHTDVGIGKGKGFTVNVPWSRTKMGDEEYRAAFNKIIMPICYEFNPQLVFISAGFDAAEGDPLGSYKVSDNTFALLCHQLCGLSDGRVITVLEGGYNLHSITRCSISVCETMLNRGTKRNIKDSLEKYASNRARLKPEAWISLRKVATTQENYWNCMKGYQMTLGAFSPPKKPIIKSRKVDAKASISTPDQQSIRRSPRLAGNNKIDELTEMMKDLNTR